MRQMVWVMSIGLAITGCSAAKSAIGVLSPKPPNVTVVNNVAPGAPAPQTVVVVASHDKAPAKQRGFFEKVGIVTVSTAVGAGLGALAGEALDMDAGSTALMGGLVGGVTGVAIVK
jgi:hypothetical protein